MSWNDEYADAGICDGPASENMPGWFDIPTPGGEFALEADGDVDDVGLGTENVNDVCLSAVFSLCSLFNKSRRFSFSDEARSFLASSAATLSSN